MARAVSSGSIADLYGVPPEEFVARRNQLAKQLRGDRDAAARVAALRRPSVGAWALNQVARSHPERIEGVLALVGRFREATDAALGGNARELRDVQAAARSTIDDVVGAAMAVLRDDGRKATDDLRRRIADTVHAALVDGDIAGELRAGRLEDDHASPGFGFSLDQQPSDRPVTSRRAVRVTAEPDRTATPDRKAQQQAERERRRLESRAEQLEERAAVAEARARGLRTEADAARAEADAAGGPDVQGVGRSRR